MLAFRFRLAWGLRAGDQHVVNFLHLVGVLVCVKQLKGAIFELTILSIALGCLRAKSLQSCLTLRPYAQQPSRLLCPWDSPGKNTAVGCQCPPLGRSSQPRDRTCGSQAGSLPGTPPGKPRGHVASLSGNQTLASAVTVGIPVTMLRRTAQSLKES